MTTGTVRSTRASRAHRSSLPDADAVVAPAGDFDVVTKPRHNTAEFEQSGITGLADGITVVPSTISPVDLPVAADLVVGDVRSDGFNDGVLADRPVAGSARPGSGGRATLHPGVEAADVRADRAELRALVRRALADDPHAEGRRRRVPELFGDTCRADAELAAVAVAGAVRRGSVAPVRRPAADWRKIAVRRRRSIRR